MPMQSLQKNSEIAMKKNVPKLLFSLNITIGVWINSEFFSAHGSPNITYKTLVKDTQKKAK